MKKIVRTMTTMILCCVCAISAGAFVHPGCLSTQDDLDRMAAKVSASEQPWKGSWDILVSNTNDWLDDGAGAVETVCVDSGTCGNNYMNLARAAAKAYQCALRYHGSSDTQFADKAIYFMNEWAATHTGWDGNTNVSLRAGLYGYQFACTAELMRNYTGWDANDFNDFKQYMLNQFYSINDYFLTYKHGTVDGHYWANWCNANVASMMAIGVLCDDQAIFDDAVNYVLNGPGNESMRNAVPFVHPCGLGQWQESGRDQGHTVMGPQLMGTICEIAWNQGVDIYGYMDNRFLASVEYISKYNLWYDVPWVVYVYRSGHPGSESEWIQGAISSSSRGSIRPGWDLVYNHYVNRLGMSAPYTQLYAEKARPEGGGGNYGTTSGGYDGLGFTTLTHSREPIASGAAPSNLVPYLEGRQITLSWAGSAYAKSYNVKRSTSSGGPYTTLATVGTPMMYYVDPGLTTGESYYYVVSANNPGGQGINSIEVEVIPNGKLHGTIIGTDGAYGGSAATKETLFDGYLGNFFDPPSSGAWAGLDLGSGISAVITEVRYCPRERFASRMVGGKFQGSNTADFSSGVEDLFTITEQPPENVLTVQSVSSSNAYRYIRFINEVNWNNAAEVQFLGNASGLNTPATPNKPKASVVNGHNINLAWNAVPGATSYNIKRSTSRGGPYVIVKNVSGASCEDKNLSGETTYFYVVSALNSAGQSDNSVEASATTQKKSPILIAYYELQGNLNDSSQNGYNAAATGSPVYVTGKIGQAMDFNGTDNYVTLPAGVADYNDMTIATWINWDGGGGWQRIFDFGNDTSQYLFLTPKSSGSNTLRFAIKDGGDEQVVETSQLTAEQWVHVAVTLAGDTATLYVNGLPVNTNDTVTINPSDFVPVNNYIGNSQWTADPLFDGRIDDFRIYNYALSDTAIFRLVQQQTDMGDLFVLAAWWLWLTENCGASSDCMDADYDGDGDMDFEDFAKLAGYWLSGS